MKEGDEEFGDRVDRAYRFNHSREVVDLLSKYLFKQNIVRSDDAPDCLEKFWGCATRGAMSVNDLAKQVCKQTSIFGRVAVVVDRQRSKNAVISVADEKKNPVKTYAYVVSPMQILDYAYDDDGSLEWVLIEEIVRDDSDPFESSGKQSSRYRLWTKNEWMLFVKKKSDDGKQRVEMIGADTHGLGEVPVVLADNILTDEMYGSPSLIADIAYLDRAVANYLSNLDAIVQDQTFSQLAMPAQSTIPGEDIATKVQELGIKRIFTFDGQAGQPMYISPDPKQAQLILDVVNRIIVEIYHTVGLSSERTQQDNVVSALNTSGVSKAYDFERVNSLLAAKADSLEIIENKIARLVCLWNGEDVKDDDKWVEYPDNFDTRGLYDEFDIAARLALIEAPQTVRRTQMRMLSEKIFPLCEKSIMKEIERELKDWPVMPMEGDTTGVTHRTAVNNGNNPTSNYYKTQKSGEAKGSATQNANGSAVDNKQPVATRRQGQAVGNT